MSNPCRHHFGPRWEHHRPRGLRLVALVFGGITLAVVAAFVFGIVVELLWNGLMPKLFSLPTIGYWQAVGLTLLARLLIGSMGHSGLGGRHGDKYRHMPLEHGPEFARFWHDEGEAAFKSYLSRIEQEGAKPA